MNMPSRVTGSSGAPAIAVGRPSLIVYSAITTGLVLLSLLLLGLWANSYFSGWTMSWGDRYRGTYNFIHSSRGGVFLERRTNCDISERFTWFRIRGGDRTPRGPHVRSRGALGFENYVGTRYCWPGHLYGMTNPFPAWDDPRWQKEPFRAVRVPYWPMVLMLVPVTARLLRGNVRSWRRYVRMRRGSCITCGYSLTGNQSGICPECGSATSEGGSTVPSGHREGLGWGWRLALAVFCGCVIGDVYFRYLYLHAEGTIRAQAFLVRLLGGAQGPDWRWTAAAAALALVPPFVVGVTVFLLASYRYAPRRSRSREEVTCRAPDPLLGRPSLPQSPLRSQSGGSAEKRLHAGDAVTPGRSWRDNWWSSRSKPDLPFSRRVLEWIMRR
jgi:hypothetical protein